MFGKMDHETRVQAKMVDGLSPETHTSRVGAILASHLISKLVVYARANSVKMPNTAINVHFLKLSVQCVEWELLILNSINEMWKLKKKKLMLPKKKKGSMGKKRSSNLQQRKKKKVSLKQKKVPVSSPAVVPEAAGVALEAISVRTGQIQQTTIAGDVTSKASTVINVWKETVDATSGRTYYYNTETGATQWTNPDTNSDTEKWQSTTDATTGKTYLFNTLTGETKWAQEAQPSKCKQNES